jgi:alpha-1,3-glucan synthase
MLSQLTKTVKMALKSTEEERAILRARSAVQRFPVVEWRQRTEDLHRRSITTSRHGSGVNAWRVTDGGDRKIQPLSETEDWNPVYQEHPPQPEWDGRSYETPPSHLSQESLAPPFLHGNSSGRQSFTSDDFYSAHSQNASVADLNNGGYNHFLEKANRTIARDQRGAPDPFLGGDLAPARPFGTHHSRLSSVESISSIVSEKSNSPLNKAIASVSHCSRNPNFLLSEDSDSSQMLTEGSLPNSCKGYRRWTRRTRNVSSLSRSSW